MGESGTSHGSIVEANSAYHSRESMATAEPMSWQVQKAIANIFVLCVKDICYYQQHDRDRYGQDIQFWLPLCMTIHTGHDREHIVSEREQVDVDGLQTERKNKNVTIVAM